jgi:tRNA-dihydrouridine synthase B
MPNKQPAGSMIDISAPLRIGSVELPNRAFLAPMSGVTDLPFRRRAHMHGAGLVVSEMVASAEYCKRRRESRMRAQFDGLPVSMLQLAGREAYWMAEAARVAEGEGADIIDINMGCPAKKVTGGYSGSALMRDLDHAMTLVVATVAAVDVPVTLKMRLGWDETSINAPELARRAVDAGVHMVTVHGRTRMQLYNGKADWSRVAEVRDVIDVPLVINGDISTRAEAFEALHLSGADAVMTGRACYGRPWLPGELAEAAKSVDVTEQPPWRADMAAYVISHYEDMLSHYGVSAGLRHARKHLGWYLDRHSAVSDPAGLRKAIMVADDPAEVIGLLKQAFHVAAPGTEENAMAA